jgi:hypothetical protein
MGRMLQCGQHKSLQVLPCLPCDYEPDHELSPSCSCCNCSGKREERPRANQRLADEGRERDPLHEFPCCLQERGTTSAKFQNYIVTSSYCLWRKPTFLVVGGSSAACGVAANQPTATSITNMMHESGRTIMFEIDACALLSDNAVDRTYRERELRLTKQNQLHCEPIKRKHAYSRPYIEYSYISHLD